MSNIPCNSLKNTKLTKKQRTDYENNSTTCNSGSINGRCVGRGFFNDEILEPIPNRIRAPSETIITNDYPNNAWIILGRDRPASLGSGYGAQGVDRASAIDLCVGMMAGTKSGPVASTDVNPNFAADAARIYISQKTNLDENFGLAEGKKEKIGIPTKGKSGIGIKADGVRIVARTNGIKLVTGKGNFLDTGADGELDSNGQSIKPSDNLGRIELIAGNDTTELALSELLTPPLLELVKLFTPIKLPNKIKKLQPIPKGDNLVLCFQYIMNIIDDLMIKVNVLTSILAEFMVAVPPALIPLPGSAALGALSALQIARLLSEIIIPTNPTNGTMKQQINAVENIYLKSWGQFYINSRHCSTT